jgi:hypothetical protein
VFPVIRKFGLPGSKKVAKIADNIAAVRAALLQDITDGGRMLISVRVFDSADEALAQRDRGGLDRTTSWSSPKGCQKSWRAMPIAEVK